MHRSLALASLALAACSPLEARETVFVDEPVHAVQLFVDHGSVTLYAGEAEAPRVELDLASTPWNPASTHVEVRDGTLRVHASCDAEPRYLCTAEPRLYLPADVTALVSVGRGDIVVSGLTGDLVAESGEGDIHVLRTTGAVEVETFQGDIHLIGLAGPVRAVTDEGDVAGIDLLAPDVTAWSGAGDVDLGLLGTVEAVDARSGAGDVVLRLPAGPYALDLVAEAGTVSVEDVFPAADGAPVHAFARAGDVRVRGE